MSGHAAAGARGHLRVVDGARRDSVARLHQFQGDHPGVVFTAPHMGGQGRYIAHIPSGSVPGDPAKSQTVSAIDLGALMDQLEEIHQGERGGQPGAAVIP